MRSAILLTVALWTIAAFSDEPPAGTGGGGKALAARPFTIGPDTTIVIGPVRADGTIDYVAALNQAWSAGVTDENNAGLTLMGAIGPGQNGTPMARLRAAMKLAQPKDGWVVIDAAAHDEYDRVLDAALPWKEADAPAVAKWLKQSAAPLDRIVAGAARTRFFIPMVAPKSGSMIAIELPYLQSMRGIVGALKARALLKLGSQDFEGFRRDIMGAIRFSRLISESPFLVGKLVAVSAEGLANSAITGASTSGSLTADQCQTLLNDLRSLPHSRPMSEGFERAERFTMLDYIQVAATYGPFAAARYIQGDADGAKGAPMDTSAHDWNQAMRKINWWYDQLAAAGKWSTHRERVAAAAKVDAAIIALRTQHPGVLELLMDIEDRTLMTMLPAIARILVRQTQTEQERLLVQISLVLRAHKARTGAYPESLAAAWPKDSEVPMDLFTRKPLIYQRQGEGYLVYSLGENGNDDGGIRESRKDDLAVKAIR